MTDPKQQPTPRGDGRVQCWPEGHATRFACEETIPDTDNATMNRFGWGFVWARDDGSASGVGPFYACPHHRSDITEDERVIALQRCEEAKALLQALTPQVEGGEDE